MMENPSESLLYHAVYTTGDDERMDDKSHDGSAAGPKDLAMIDLPSSVKMAALYAKLYSSGLYLSSPAMGSFMPHAGRPYSVTQKSNSLQ